MREKLDPRLSFVLSLPAVLAGPRAEVIAPCISITEGTRAPIRIAVADLDTDDARRFVHVTQLSAGARVGGFTLELRKGLRRAE